MPEGKHAGAHTEIKDLAVVLLVVVGVVLLFLAAQNRESDGLCHMRTAAGGQGPQDVTWAPDAKGGCK